MKASASVCLSFVLLASACAHQAAAPTAAPENAGYAEIAALEKKIESKKSALSGGSSAQSFPLPSGESAPSPMSGGDPAAAVRCDGVCQAAEEICICHRRICRLAGEINDERSAESCRRSQRDCEEAGKSCATCR